MRNLDRGRSQAQKVERLLFESPEFIGSDLKFVDEWLQKGQFLGIEGAVAIADDEKSSQKLEPGFSGF